MKTKSKALAIISTLMLCIIFVFGIFPVKVSAASIKPLSELDIYFLTGGTGDWEGVEVKENYKSFNKYKNSYYPKCSFYYLPDNTDIDSQYELTYNLDSSISRFKIGFGILNGVANGRKFPYYIYFCGVDDFDSHYGEPLLVIQTFASMSPIRYDLKDGKYCLNSDSDIVFVSITFPLSGLTDTYRNGELRYFNPQILSLSILNDNSRDFSIFNYPSDVTDIKEGKYYYFNGDTSSYSITWNEIYSNCDIEINGFNFRNEPFKNLKDQIDVKLTPEFGLDMDRVFDKNTGQNDYFKFEVTNNSNNNIQFCASIVDEAGDFSFEDFFEGTILDGIFQDYTSEWEESYWNYIIDNQHYVDFYREDDKKFFGLFQGNITRYAELQKGNFYWVLLKPGEHLEDYIYWENVKINPKKKYSFIVDCIPTELDYPTDIFYSMQGDNKIFSHPEEIKDKNYNRDSTLERYAINAEDTIRACNYVFSVMSMPDFTSTGMNFKLCKCNNHQKIDHTKNAVKEGNAEERPNADCEIIR